MPGYGATIISIACPSVQAGSHFCFVEYNQSLLNSVHRTLISYIS